MNFWNDLNKSNRLSVIAKNYQTWMINQNLNSENENNHTTQEVFIYCFIDVQLDWLSGMALGMVLPQTHTHE